MRAAALSVPVPPLHFRTSGPLAYTAGDHPTHERGRRCLVRYRQRGCTLVPRRGVRGGHAACSSSLRFRSYQYRAAASSPRLFVQIYGERSHLPGADSGNKDCNS